ncbi:endonuclease [Vairimorpha necatrix]|uniref:RNA-directed DNA polymerase n=1 Tax=Vairimorpha necatrix TaxID=6039 RepID=A0AAX4JG67_9MICR
MENPNKTFDMATTTNNVGCFTGEAGEDVNVWLRDIMLVGEVSKWTNDQFKTALVSKLRGKALSWASQTLGGKMETVSLEEILHLIKKRFGSYKNNDITLSRFLSIMVPETREDYSQMLQEATVIYERSLINLDALCQMVINKSPMEIKALLYQTATTVQTWQGFIQKAEEISWIPYPDKMLARTKLHDNAGRGPHTNFYKEKGFKRNITHEKLPRHTNKRCTLHGECNHSTRDCKALTIILNRERNNLKRKNINAVEEYESDEKDHDNKEIEFYLHHIQNSFNPFFVESRLFNKNTKVLLDTGADVSVINYNDIPQEERNKIIRYNGVVKGIGNEILKIEGYLKDCIIEINGKGVIFSPLIIKDIKYVIIGANVICDNKKLILDILNAPKYRINQMSNSACDLEENKILKEYEDVFKTEISDYNLCTAGSHRIQTNSTKIICQRNGRIPVSQEEAVNEEINKLLELGILRESRSPWCSRILMVPKPDKTWRMCVDYRGLNSITVKDAYMTPRIDEIFDSLSTATIFTILDATSGFHQIPLQEEDKEKTAFSYRGKLYEFNRMPFGLCNAPATFQRAMDNIFRKENHNFVIPYLDDIIIYSRNKEEHKKHVRIVLGKIRAANLSLNKKKCKFFRSEIKILGNVIGNGIIKVDETRIKDIQAYPIPTTIKELRSFLGMANYCRDFVTKMAEITGPLYDVLKGEKQTSGKKIKLTDKQLDTFKTVKKVLSQNTIRTQPNFKAPFILVTDASETGIGAVLLQKNKTGAEKMIAAFSKRLDNCQKNYSVTDKELLGLVKGIEHFRHYLLGSKFTLRTDHKALIYLWTVKDPTSRILRWALKLAEYDFELEYIKGEHNIADGFSRFHQECETCNIDLHQLSNNNINDILEEYHKISGHGTSNTMKFMISQAHKWKTMHQDISKFVSNCKTCLRSGYQRVKTKNKVILSERPNQLWEFDLLGKLSDNSGSGYIFQKEL